MTEIYYNIGETGTFSSMGQVTLTKANVNYFLSEADFSTVHSYSINYNSGTVI